MSSCSLSDLELTLASLSMTEAAQQVELRQLMERHVREGEEVTRRQAGRLEEHSRRMEETHRVTQEKRGVMEEQQRVMDKQKRVMEEKLRVIEEKRRVMNEQMRVMEDEQRREMEEQQSRMESMISEDQADLEALRSWQGEAEEKMRQQQVELNKLKDGILRQIGAGAAPEYSVIYCTVLHCTVLYCIVLDCTHCTVLHCTVLAILNCQYQPKYPQGTIADKPKPRTQPTTCVLHQPQD